MWSGVYLFALFVGVLWLIAFLLRTWVASFQAPGAPRMGPPRVFRPFGAVGLRGQAILLQPSRVAPDVDGEPGKADIQRLIRARRFADASRAVDPSDTKALTALAVARQGPLPDLMFAALHGTRREKAKAKAVFSERFPGQDWGLGDSNAIYLSDPVTAIVLGVDIYAMRGKAKAASRTARRYVRLFPQADDARHLQLASVMFDVLAGRHEAARSIAVEMANTEANDEVRNSASRVSQGVAAALRARGSLEPTRARRPDYASRATARAVIKLGRDWPQAPHDLLDIVGSQGKAVADLELDPHAAAGALRQGYQVWVGIVDHFGECRAVMITAIEPHVGVVLLSQGQPLEWSALEAASVWGHRMLVVRRRGLKVEGTLRPTLFTEFPYPRGANGKIDGGPGALEEVREAARRHPTDAAASFNYALALESARVVGSASYDLQSHQRHLAVTAVRFPGARWPRELLAALPGGQTTATDLLATGLRGDNLNSARWTALARFDPQHADEHLRDALTRSMVNGPALLASGHRAAARGNGHSVDAHIEVLKRVLGENDDVLHLRQLREVVWRGPDGAIATVPAARSDPDGRLVRLALAAQSANRIALETEVAVAQSGLHDFAVRDAPVLLVAHQGNYRAIVDTVVKAAQPDGLGGILSRVLVTSTEVLSVPGDRALVDSIAPLVRAGDRGVADVVGWLEAPRPALALEIARLQCAAPGDRFAAAIAVVRMELTLASRLWAEGASASERFEAQAAAARARDALVQVRSSVPSIHGWQAIDAASWLYEDPERSRDGLASAPGLPGSLAVFVAASAAERALGNHELADRYLARAAVPDVVADGLVVAASLGLRRELDAVFSIIDPNTAAQATWAWYSRRGRVPNVPRVPGTGEIGLSYAAMWRLGEDGLWQTLRDAVTQRFDAADLLTFDDGADRVALESLAKAGLGDATALSQGLKHSSHPAMLKAAWIARQHGIDIGDTRDIGEFAPGLVSTTMGASI